MNRGTCVAYAYSMMAVLPEATERKGFKLDTGWGVSKSKSYENSDTWTLHTGFSTGIQPDWGPDLRKFGLMAR